MDVQGVVYNIVIIYLMETASSTNAVLDQMAIIMKYILICLILVGPYI